MHVDVQFSREPVGPSSAELASPAGAQPGQPPAAAAAAAAGPRRSAPGDIGGPANFPEGAAVNPRRNGAPGVARPFKRHPRNSGRGGPPNMAGMSSAMMAHAMRGGRGRGGVPAQRMYSEMYSE